MSIAEVQARMAAITAQFVTPMQAPIARTVTTRSTSGSDFAAELASATGALSTTEPGSESATAGGAATGTAAEVIADAKRYLGVPYVWGGTNPATGLDCSGFTQLVFSHFGIDLPRVSRDQARTGTAVDGLANARPGDLLAFDNPVDHIAIYLGDHKMIHAPRPGKSVEISDVYETPSAIRRVLPEQAAGASAGTSAGGLNVAQILAAYPNLANLATSALSGPALSGSTVPTPGGTF